MEIGSDPPHPHSPAAYGGFGLGTLDGAILGEETAWGCTGISTAIEANSLAEMPPYPLVGSRL